MSRRLHLIIMVFAVLGLFAGINLIAATGFSGARLDLTERNLYRLSEGTRDTINELEEPVRWTFYYSRRVAADYPAVRAYGARVREMLRGYEAVSGGRIILQEIDPEAFSEQEDDALRYGLTPAPAGNSDRLFFGLVARDMVDEVRTINYFAPEREAQLEYELTRLLADLSRATEPVLAILTGLALEPGRPGAIDSAIIRELDAAYTLIWVSRSFVELPQSDALLILHPPELAEDQLYAIDQFVMGGGRLIAALDPMAHAALRPGSDGLPPPNARRSSDLGPLLEAWGVAFTTEQVAMDIETGLPVQVTEDGRARVRGYPLWFSVSPEQMSATDLATSGLIRGINFGSPGFLEAAETPGTRFEPLLQTGERGTRLDTETAARNPSPAEISNDYPEAGEALTLAARMSGRLVSAFPSGPPEMASSAMEGATHIAENENGDVVVIADIDWLDDPFFMRNDPAFGPSAVADNLAFMANLTDLALGDRALIGLRSREPSARPMLRVDALRAEAERRFDAEQVEIQTQIDAGQARLITLQDPSVTSDAALSLEPDEIRAEMSALRDEMTVARARLRDIERDFRRDIDGLEAQLRFWTIWFPPLAVLIFALSLAFLRRRRLA